MIWEGGDASGKRDGLSESRSNLMQWIQPIMRHQTRFIREKSIRQTPYSGARTGENSFLLRHAGVFYFCSDATRQSRNNNPESKPKILFAVTRYIVSRPVNL
jgi:hypothetical protein